MSSNTLSLCLIVKNEEAMLPEFLDSVAGLWDELIVADTGSTDRTVDLLTAAGAQVVDFPWRNDFAAARNASLAPATGDWILFLDADERVTPRLHEQIRALLDDDEAGAATVIMRNAMPGGHVRETPLLRLFRRHRSIVWEHRIHEDVAAAVGRYLQQSGRTLRHLSGVVEHLGYVREHAAARDKKQRDLHLLQAAVTEDPGDLYCWFKILELARFWNDRPLWQRTAPVAAQHLAATDPEVLRRLPFAGELAALICTGLFDDDAEALAWLDAQAEHITPSAAYHLSRGLLAEALDRRDEAARAFTDCLDAEPSASSQLRQVRPLLGLCRLTAADGRLAEALDLARRAVAAGPRDPEALMAVLTFCELVEGPSARQAFVQSHRDTYGATPELSQVLGTYDLDRNDFVSAITELHRAAGDPPSGPAALTLAQALLGSGDLAGAENLLHTLLPDEPAAGLGLLTCALADGRDIDLDLALDQSTADDHLRRWIRVLWNSRKTEWMANFADGCGGILPVFPWLPAYLQAQTRRLRDDRRPG